jgi:hypothetical protein
MQRGLPSRRISASSEYDRYHGASRGRLHARRAGKYIGAWAAKISNHYQWLQISFSKLMRIVKIATQGRRDVNQWVRRYRFFYSTDGAHFAVYKKNGNIKVGLVKAYLLLIQYA